MPATTASLTLCRSRAATTSARSPVPPPVGLSPESEMMTGFVPSPLAFSMHSASRHEIDPYYGDLAETHFGILVADRIGSDTGLLLAVLGEYCALVMTGG